MREVKIISIVFLQGDDYSEMEKDLLSNPDNNVHITLQSGEDHLIPWLTDEAIIDYLLQWYIDDDDYYESNWYDASLINTEFLGHEYHIPHADDKYLFSHSEALGYAGLSKIIEFRGGDEE